MRITGGKARGIPLKAPASDKTRPATDYLREAVYSSLGPLVEGASVLDLFAGTGAYGLEALSRGAQSVTWVEQSRKAFQCLEHNSAAVQKSLQSGTGEVPTTQPICADVFRWATKPQDMYGIIFADPPYPILDKKGIAILELATQMLNNTSSNRLILEAPGSFTPTSIPPQIQLLKHIKKGNHQPSALIFSK